MKIQETRSGDELILSVEGRLDTVTAPEMMALLEKQLPTVSKLIIDMTNLEYISSAGIRTVVFAQRKLAGDDSLIIRNPNEMIREVFDVTGLTPLLNIE